MNWVLIAAVLFLAWHIAWGYNKGFLRVLYSIGKWILIIVLLLSLTPPIANCFKGSSVYDEVHERVEARIEQKVQEKLEESQEEKTSELSMKLPKAITDKLPNLVELADGKLRADGAYDAAADELTDLAMLGFAAIFVIVLCIVLCIIINKLFSVLEKLPGIEQVNNTLGLFAGAAKGMLLIWTFMAIVAAEAGMALGQFMIPYFYESPILQALYENNLVLTLMMTFF